MLTTLFPLDMQAFAGAVFNVTAQFGETFGLAILSVISRSVSQAASRRDQIVGVSEEVLMEGYRAAFWTNFGFMIAATCVAVVGLHHLRSIGQETDNDSTTSIVDERNKV